MKYFYFTLIINLSIWKMKNKSLEDNQENCLPPSISASRIISSTSSSVSFSPKFVITWLKKNNRWRNKFIYSTFFFSYRSSAADINPLPSLSKTRNASRISSSESVSFIFRAIIVKNSGKSIVPLPKNWLKKIHCYFL